MSLFFTLFKYLTITTNRREFLQKIGLGTAGMSLAATAMPLTSIQAKEAWHLEDMDEDQFLC